MTHIRTPARDEVPSLVDIHRTAFQGFVLTRLGGRFLELLYEAFVEQPDGLIYAAYEEATDRLPRMRGGCMLGFVAGSRQPEQFYARLRRRRGISFGIAALPALLTSPHLIAGRLLAALCHKGDALPELPGYWLLGSLAVLPQAGGRGIGSDLVARFCDAARSNGAPGVYLTTDTDNNSAVRAFYARNGFSARAQIMKYNGRKMTLYARRLSSRNVTAVGTGPPHASCTWQ